MLFTRVVTAGGGSIMIGACPWVIPASWHIPIIDTRERLRPKQLLTREELLDYDLEIRQAYHEIVDALLHPALPVLQNTDGDPLELTTLTYELSVTATEAVERLTPLATLHGDVYLVDEACDAAGVLRQPGIRAPGPRPAPFSKPPPSASRPSHRARKSIRQARLTLHWIVL